MEYALGCANQPYALIRLVPSRKRRDIVRILQSASDRLLSVFAPKTKAAAHCLFTVDTCKNGVIERCIIDQCSDTRECWTYGTCGGGEG